MKKFEHYTLIKQLEKKAIQSDSNFCIAAAAFTKRKNLLGISTNKKNDFLKYSKKGTGKHAEANLIKKFGKQIDKIYILRVGKQGDPLPIEPCKTCAKMAKKFGIDIVNLHYEYNILNKNHHLS